MHTALKLFQLQPTQGLALNRTGPKIAVRLPAGQAFGFDAKANGFLDILGGLLDKTPKKMHAAFGAFDLLPMDPDHFTITDDSLADAAIPVFVLTGDESENEAALSLLIEQWRTGPPDPYKGDIKEGGGHVQIPLKDIGPVLGPVVDNGGREARADTVVLLQGPSVGPVRIAQEQANPLADGGLEFVVDTPTEKKTDTLAQMARQPDGMPKTTDKPSIDPKDQLAPHTVFGKQIFENKTGPSTAADRPPTWDTAAADPKGGLRSPEISGGAIEQPQAKVEENKSQAAVNNLVRATADTQSRPTEQTQVKQVPAQARQTDPVVAPNTPDKSTKDTTGGPLADGKTTFRDIFTDAGTSRAHASFAGVNEEAATRENEETSAKSYKTEIIRQIVNRMTLTGNGRHSQMQVHLKPEFLGNLRLQVTTENHQVMVRMTAESSAVKEMIEQNLHVLKNELQQHGLHIDKFDVFVGNDNDAWKNHQQQTSRQFGRGRFARPFSEKEIAEDDAEDTMPRAALRRHANGGHGEVDFFA